MRIQDPHHQSADPEDDRAKEQDAQERNGGLNLRRVGVSRSEDGMHHLRSEDREHRGAGGQQDENPAADGRDEPVGGLPFFGDQECGVGGNER